MKIKTLFLSIFILLIAFSTWSAPEKLLLKDYLTKITKNDPAYKALFHEKKTAEGLLKALDGLYAVQMFGNYSHAQQGESQFGSFIIKEGESTVYGYGLSKKLKVSGTELSAQFLRSDTNATYATQPNDTDVVTNRPSTVIRITQPLWQDFMGILSRMPIRRMEIQEEVAELSEEENAENYFARAIDEYYDWLALTLALEPLKESYKNAELLLTQVKRQYRNDVALKTDLLRSQEAVLVYKNALEETLYNWNMVGSDLYKKMGKKFVWASSWDELPVIPDAGTNFCQEITKQDIKDVRTTLIFEKMLKSYDLEVDENERMALPRLSVYGQNTGYKIRDDATDSYTNLNNRDTEVGLEFSVALDVSAPEGVIQQLQERIKKTKEELQDTKLSLSNLYDNYLLKAKAWERLVENAKAIADSSAERLKIETRRYRSGKSILRDIADYRNQFTRNETDHLNKMIQLSKLYVQIASLNDELLPEVKKTIGDE